MSRVSEIYCKTPGCRSEPRFMCLCKKSLNFLCENCLDIHLSEPVIHSYTELDNGRDAIKRKQDEELYASIEPQIQDYIQTICSYQSSIKDFRDAIVHQIDQKCQEANQLLIEYKQKAEISLKQVQQNSGSISSTKEEILGKFKDNGIRKLFSPYLEEFEINFCHFERSLKDLFNFYPKHTDISYSAQNLIKPHDLTKLFIPKINSKNLIRYDAGTKETREFNLKEFIEFDFIGTSCCILPNEQVLLVGGSKPLHSSPDIIHLHGDTYKFNPSTGLCTKLGSLSTPRGCISLSVHKAYIYAFGGVSCSKNADKLHYLGNSWESLEDMKYPRASCGSYTSKDRIYLFGGLYSTTIEYYDLEKNKFYLLEEAYISVGRNLVAKVEDRVYVINKDLLVLNEELEVIIEEKSISPYAFLSLSDVLIQGKFILFYDRESQHQHQCNTTTREVKQLIDF